MRIPTGKFPALVLVGVNLPSVGFESVTYKIPTTQNQSYIILTRLRNMA